MATKIFVNLHVKDLPTSKTFYGALGFTFNPQFTDDGAACMVISEDIYAMLVTEARFRDFTPKAISDAHQSSEVLLALSRESREEVDELADKALAAGGTKLREPEDHGFMYGRSFNDPDGHIWEAFWMNPNHVMED